ncbi:hypothetical protein D0N36_08160 [Hymenobacter lapidiphilus]|uniref:hypothetical protein n=1 Tax=Hymenobacter sp. CCM 8763 TaxID=2303334 RepID=UPI000E351AD2|nr:hypothetical protein [Hymenobacter sp. CCM 8763]RFP65655.1 hypothetical protein D0N36_08160 [Hymenobacter sp. CCM 8763]
MPLPASSSSTVWQRWAERVFFGLLLLLGLLVHGDYGVSTDEPAHHLNGLVNVKYVAELVAPELARRQAQYAHIPALATHPDRDHGVLFEIPDSLLGLLAQGDSAAYYRLRHLLIFLVFMVGVWALYRLATHYTRDWRWGLAAAGALVLSPRLFAEAFYNAQDIVFMALFAVAMLTLVRLVARPGAGRAAVHGLACAAAIDVRVGGGLLVVFTLLALGWQALNGPATRRAAWVRSAGVYLLTTAAAAVAGWPYLWADPIARLLEVLRRMGQFPWQGRNLYLGELLSGSATPWHYIPVWLTVTTPWPYLLAAAGGLAAILGAGLRRSGHFQTRTGQFDWLVLGWLLGPVLLVIGLNSAVYNGWRHLYFVYPALLLLAARGGQMGQLLAGRYRAGRWVGTGVGVVLLAGVLHTAYRMVREHPQQQVYFSLLPNQVVAEQFDRDYWGLAYRHGLGWVLASDSAARIRVGAARPDLLYNNSLILPAAQRARLVFTSPPYPAGTYLFTNYARYQYGPGLLPADTLGRQVYRLRVNGLPVLGVFKR